MAFPEVSYEVTYIDQVNEGRVVWATHDEWLETEAIARQDALEASQTKEFKSAKVVKVTRETIAHYVEGEEQAP